MTDRPPIAVFAFRRPDLLSATLGALRRCNGFAESEVTVFVDGPRGPADDHDVQITRGVVTELSLPNVRLVARHTNMGLRRSIYSGVGELCKAHGRVIVFEDDLEMSPHTLDYFKAALNKYAENARVWSVNAYMFRVPELRKNNQALVIPWAHPWGWATWQRAWSRFELDRPIPRQYLDSPSFRRFFDVGGIRDCTDQLALQHENLINSWYIQWYRLIFESGGVSIFPSQSYVRNTGIKSVKATHGSRLNPYYFLSAADELCERVQELPNDIVIDWQSIDLIASSWDARLQKAISRFGSLNRRMRRKR